MKEKMKKLYIFLKKLIIAIMQISNNIIKGIVIYPLAILLFNLYSRIKFKWFSDEQLLKDDLQAVGIIIVVTVILFGIKRGLLWVFKKIKEDIILNWKELVFKLKAIWQEESKQKVQENTSQHINQINNDFNFKEAISLIADSDYGLQVKANAIKDGTLIESGGRTIKKNINTVGELFGLNKEYYIPTTQERLYERAEHNLYIAILMKFMTEQCKVDYNQFIDDETLKVDRMKLREWLWGLKKF